MEEKECLRGFQPNPTTGICEPIFPIPTVADAKKKKKCEPKCKKGTRCNPATGICDPRNDKKIRCPKKCIKGTKCNTRKGVCETRKNKTLKLNKAPTPSPDSDSDDSDSESDDSESDDSDSEPIPPPKIPTPSPPTLIPTVKPIANNKRNQNKIPCPKICPRGNRCNTRKGVCEPNLKNKTMKLSSEIPLPIPVPPVPPQQEPEQENLLEESKEPEPETVLEMPEEIFDSNSSDSSSSNSSDSSSSNSSDSSSKSSESSSNSSDSSSSKTSESSSKSSESSSSNSSESSSSNTSDSSSSNTSEETSKTSEETSKTSEETPETETSEETPQPEPEMDILYPTYDDPLFAQKIAKKREFADTQYEDTPTDIRRQAEILCNAEFEPFPHQLFVRNFLSPQTPYRSLLLFHGLGSGKTCSAIGVCEEYRQYMKQIGSEQRIIIVGSKNVQANFYKQLFNEHQLRELAEARSGKIIPSDVNSCVGSALLEEINPTHITNLSVDKIVSKLNILIKQYYSFFGYQSLANYINRKITNQGIAKDEKARIRKIKENFNGRLIVIDEMHNLRMTSDNRDENKKKTSQLLFDIAKHGENVRFLLLSATPMYNSHEEVLWWLNLMRVNDKRPPITRAEIFANPNTQKTKQDIFKPKSDNTKPQENGKESGQERLERALIGYVSYVRGENPFSFPYRIYPEFFLSEEAKPIHTLTPQNIPTIQMNKKAIENPIENLPLFLTTLSNNSFQAKVYQLKMEYLLQHHFNYVDKFGATNAKSGFEEMDGFGYTLLQSNIEILDIVFPSMELERYLKTNPMFGTQTGGVVFKTAKQQIPPIPQPIAEPIAEPAPPTQTKKLTTLPPPPQEKGNQEPDDESDQDDQDQDQDDQDEPEYQEPEEPQIDDPKWLEAYRLVSNCYGKKAMNRCFKFITTKTANKMEQNHKYEYNPDVFRDYGRFLSPQNLPKYSAKMSKIIDIILRSTGIVLVFSEYIDGGAIPFALALEEAGFHRHIPKGSQFSPTLFNTSKTQGHDKIISRDATTMKPKTDPLFQETPEQFHQAKYAIMCGNMAFSPNNTGDLNIINSQANKMGKQIKVVIISKALFEGVDFKNLRQVHILEPWYNMNRIEQIVGRAVRDRSHCSLPFEERNVEIYLHGTLLETASIPAVIPAAPEQPPSEQPRQEAADMYIYRMAESKAKRIGEITRILKETAVDCLLNIRQTKFTVQDLLAIAQNKNIQLSLSTSDTQNPEQRKQIIFQIGDKPYTDMCDYMDNCSFQCKPIAKQPDASEISYSTYSVPFLQNNRAMLKRRIKQLFREEMVYTTKQLINHIQTHKEYPLIQINDTLSYLLTNPNETLIDKYGRTGRLTNYDEYYAFLPSEISDEKATMLERSRPVDYKNTSLEFEPPAQQPQIPETQQVQDNEIPAQIPEQLQQLQQPQQPEQPQQQENPIQKMNETNTVWDQSLKSITPLLINLIPTLTQENLKTFQYGNKINQMTLNEKLMLANEIQNPTEPPNTWHEIAKQYFQERTIQDTQKKHKAIVLSNIVKDKPQNQLWSQTLKPPTLPNQPATEKYLGWYPIPETLKNQLFKRNYESVFKIPETQIHYKYGFLNYFLMNRKTLTEEVVFKIKNLNQKNRNNIGARIDQAGVKIIKDHIQELLKPREIDFSAKEYAKLNKSSWCVLLEAILWFYSITNPQKKAYFPLEWTIENHLESLFCKVDGNGNVFDCEE